MNVKTITSTSHTYSLFANDHVTLNQPRALHTVYDRLFTEFGGTSDYDFVRHVVNAAYDRLEAHARFDDHLPLLAERAARERLRALARR